MEKSKLTNSKMEEYSGSLGNGTADVLVKVNTANYVPSGLKPRTKVSPFIFTLSKVTNSVLQFLQKDKKVVSYSIDRKMNQIP